MRRNREREDTEVEVSTPDPDRYTRTLARGILVFRWVWLAWMSGLAASSADDLRLPALAWASIGAAGAWTAWLTATRHKWTQSALWFDLALCAWLVLASGLVVNEGEVISGRPFFATGYPLSAPLFWGAARGPLGGVSAALVLGVCHALSRPLNGVPFASLEGKDVQNMVGAALNYVVAGVAVGIVSRVLARSGRAVAEATEKLVEERERAARLAEREKLARQIHDSVLQSLAFVHKRARELSSQPAIPSADVAELSDIAGRQEEELRSLILRDPEEAPQGTASLRHLLEASAREVDGLNVGVTAVGPIWMPRGAAEELAAAVRQALENAARHSQATRVTLFAEAEQDEVTVTIRDDGVGFEYDEDRLARDGKAGILRSMKGRTEELGGRMTIDTRPGKGTEVEFKVPQGKVP
ncbi:MAG: sensor histidine kinase [Actinomycetota bacterium]